MKNEDLKKILTKEAIILSGFLLFWIISFVRNHYFFKNLGIADNFRSEMLYALGTTLIAYTIILIIRLILWTIRVLKEK